MRRGQAITAIACNGNQDARETWKAEGALAWSARGGPGHNIGAPGDRLSGLHPARGRFVLTRTYGLWNEGEQRDAMMLLFGKCSLVNGP